MEQGKQEVCNIRIMFPVESDEQAISYKKKISEVMAEMPDVTIQFSLIQIPETPVGKSV